MTRYFHPIRWLRTHPFGADLLLALLVTAIGLIATAVEPPTADIRPFEWWAVPLVVGSTLPIAWRRRSTVAVLAIVTLFQAAVNFYEFNGAGWLGILIALYTVAAHIPQPRSVKVAGVFAAFVLAFIGLGLATGEDLWGAVISSIISCTTAFVLGDNMRRRRERLHLLTERAERAERERDLLARERVNEERTRIARELHDVVAHSVSVMVIQASAARRQLANHPERATEALITIETSGRSAMNEMRRILGVLRTDDGSGVVPIPQLGDLPSLLNADSDLPIDVVIEGDLAAVAPSTQLAAFRVVQEALTNVRKHAGVVRRVDVVVRQRDGQLAVSVADDGRGSSASNNREGFGLVGMRERVEAASGTLDVGPRIGGGWSIGATFPLAGGAPSAPERVEFESVGPANMAGTGNGAS